jgi:hypothetical protein
MDTAKPLQNHINFVNELAECLASIGFPVNEEDILLSLLASLLLSYENVVVTLKTHHAALTVDLVTITLLNEERRQINYAKRNILPKTETATYVSQGCNCHIADYTAKNGNKPDLVHITCYMLSQIFTFSLHLSWSRAGVYPDARSVPIIPPDVPLHPDGGDAPLPLMRLMR